MTRIATAPSRPKRPRMSYEAFLNTYCDGEHLEWVDGEVVPMPPITGAHNDETNHLTRWIGEWVEHFDLGKIHTDPFQMKTGPNLPGRAPDMIFVATRNLGRLHRLHLEGPADVAVEIISPSSVRVDRVDKFSEYERGGVGEYWLIDPDARTAEFFRLNEAGKFDRVSIADDGIFRSEAIKGFWIRIDWLWNPPKFSAIRREWGID